MTLILFCGPSGVGKTSIMRNLRDKHKFVFLRNYTTRNLRCGETDRTHIEEESLLELEARNETAFINKVHGNSYSVLIKDLDDAKNSRDIHMFDIFPAYLGKLFLYFEKCFFIAPEANTQLESQLRLDGREDRIAVISAEVDAAESAWVDWKNDSRCHRLINYAGGLQITVDYIAKLMVRTANSI